MGIFKKRDKEENREVYYIDYYDEHGKRLRESTGSSHRAFAKELLTNRKDEVNQRKKFPERYLPEIKFSDFVDNDYLPLHAKGMKDERNIKRICEVFKKRFGSKYMHEITSSMVLQFKKERLGKAADNTINNELNYLSGVFTKAIEWDKATLNPVRRVKRFRGVERKRILETWEIKALIAAAASEKMPPHLLPLLAFDLNTGLRKGELLSLKWSDVNYESLQILIRAENAKYNRSRYIDLNKHALAVLKSLPKRSEYVFCDRHGRPFKDFHRSFVSAVELAKLKDLRIHDLRRTFGSICIMDGATLPTVQAFMGHRDISTTIKHYSHLVSAFKKDEIKKIEGRMDTCMDTALFTKPPLDRKSLKKNGAPGKTRTSGTRFRKPLLYPPELQGQVDCGF